MSDKDKGNIFVTSNNQMGGVTAHTVNFGPTARSMNDQLGQQLRDNIPQDAKVTVTAVLGDGEAFGFANQVLSWLKANGYSNVNGVKSNPTITGWGLRFCRRPKGFLQTDRPASKRLAGKCSAIFSNGFGPTSPDIVRRWRLIGFENEHGAALRNVTAP